MPEPSGRPASNIAAAPVGWAFMMGVSPISKTTRRGVDMASRGALGDECRKKIVRDVVELGQSSGV
jgi:hypothetical protein